MPMVFLLVAAVGPTGDALPIRHGMRPPCRDAHGVGDGLATHECQQVLGKLHLQLVDAGEPSPAASARAAAAPRSAVAEVK